MIPDKLDRPRISTKTQTPGKYHTRRCVYFRQLDDTREVSEQERSWKDICSVCSGESDKTELLPKPKVTSELNEGRKNVYHFTRCHVYRRIENPRRASEAELERLDKCGHCKRLSETQ